MLKRHYLLKRAKAELEKFRKNRECVKIYKYVLKVIRSCKTDEQLEVAVEWADRVMMKHNITFEMLEMVNKAKRAKKLQIKNGLAIVYSAY